mgnify:CR=1 FL=1
MPTKAPLPVPSMEPLEPTTAQEEKLRAEGLALALALALRQAREKAEEETKARQEEISRLQGEIGEKEKEQEKTEEQL